MGFWTLFEVASMPILEVLIISALGAFMATPYCNLLHADARKSLNKIVFMVFTPCLMFSSLAKTVTFQDIISWWFMPVNIGLTFLFGGILGWIAVKILKPQKHLEGLIIASSSSGNLGNLMLIIVPAICTEKGSIFGDESVCSSVGLSYASFSMALGGFFIWTYTYQLMRTSSIACKEALEEEKEEEDTVKEVPSSRGLIDDEEKGIESPLLIKGAGDDDHQQDTAQLAVVVQPPSARKSSSIEEDDNTKVERATSGKPEKVRTSCGGKVMAFLHQILEELLAPPTLAAIVGFIFGATKWLRHLIIGDSAPLRVIQDSVNLLGNGTIPCITLILGGNLTRGLHSARIKPTAIMGVVCIRYLILPMVGIGVVKAAGYLGFLPTDPLYHYVLMIQFTLPPAMNISTMAGLFDVGEEECSVMFMWTYLVAALALTVWSTVYMWILS